MPHITIQMFEGRTENKKQELGVRVAQIVIQTLDVSPEHVSVSIQDIPKAEWDEKVYAKFMAQPEVLYRKPGYGPDED